MSEIKEPPAHCDVRLTSDSLIFQDHYFYTPDEAISLGLAIMESGLYLKAKMKEKK